MEDNNQKNPLVSYLLFTYNQEKYVRESVEAALAQSYSPLEIIISDDCSTDRTFDVIQEVISKYEGPHSIRINRNEQNLGIGGHFSKVILELSSGDYLITVGGDDISNAHHAQIAVQEILNLESIHVVDFSASIIDAAGVCVRQTNAMQSAVKYKLNDYLRMAHRLEIFAPGRIISRELILAYGSINSDCPTEDTVIVLRALLSGGICRMPANVIQYRRPGNSASSRSGLSRMNNASIIEQYCCDIGQAFALQHIDLVTYRWLKLRLKLEHIVRNSCYRFNIGTLNYYIYRSYAKLLVCVYKGAISFRRTKFIGNCRGQVYM